MFQRTEASSRRGLPIEKKVKTETGGGDTGGSEDFLKEKGRRGMTRSEGGVAPESPLVA